jgi:hypothetical protein
MADENKVLPFRVGPTIDEEAIERAREMFNPQAFFDAVAGLTNGRTLAESIAEGIQASIEQLRGEYVFNARAMLAGALADIHAQYPQPSIADAVAGFMQAAQESESMFHTQAAIAGQFYRQTPRSRKDEGCERKIKQERARGKAHDLGEIG